ncbi:hypothetical protein R1sor_024872 [Riccia sorocarpa]|uniref:Retrotransposon gag domain-containing protein n=1 Tax=Riccia sorocarpa TaxID=122646 RepID=A0ABD3GTL7_9MARC
MVKERTQRCEKKRKQPLQPIEEDRVMTADTPVMQTHVVEDEEPVRPRNKGKRPALERVSIDTGTDAGPSNPADNHEDVMARVLAELDFLKKANEEINKANEEKNSKIQILATQINPSGKSFGWSEALLDRFTPKHQDIHDMAELKLFRQTGSLVQYIRDFDKRVDKFPRLNEYAKICEFMGGLRREAQRELYKMTKFLDLCSELLKEAEKLTAVEPDYASTIKTSKVVQNNEPPKKGKKNSFQAG